MKVVLRPHLLVLAGERHQVGVLSLQLVQDLLVGRIHTSLKLALERIFLTGDRGAASAMALLWLTEVDESGRIASGVAFDLDPNV